MVVVDGTFFTQFFVCFLENETTPSLARGFQIPASILETPHDDFLNSIPPKKVEKKEKYEQSCCRDSSSALESGGGLRGVRQGVRFPEQLGRFNIPTGNLLILLDVGIFFCSEGDARKILIFHESFGFFWENVR